MSIQSEINRISGNISDSLDAVAAKGVTVPVGSTSDDLAGLIELITGSSGENGDIYQDENGYLVLSDEPGTNVSVTSLSVTTNGTYTAPTGTAYSPVNVNVQPVLQSKTVSPSESQQTVTPDSGKDGLSSVTVNAVSSSYVGSGVTRRSSSDLTASGATVTAPAGYYSSSASTSVASGSVTARTDIIGTDATISTYQSGLILSKSSVNNTPTVSAGYISSATYQTANVQLRADCNIQSAQTITPSTSAQTIASGTYLAGTQTIAGDANLVSGNIKSGVSIFNVNGSYSGSSTHRLTILSNIDGRSGTYVRYNNQNYASANDYFDFSENDTIELHIQSSTGFNFIYYEGDRVLYSQTVNVYNVTAPSSNMFVDIRASAMYAYSETGYLQALVSGKQISCILPGIENIGDYAFYGRTTTISEIHSIPNSVTGIGKYAFAGNDFSLSIESLPSNLTSISDHAFYDSCSLNFAIPNSVTSIGDYAFALSSSPVNLTSEEIRGFPTGLTTVPKYLFQNRKGMTFASLPTGVTTIQQYAFQNCSSLDWTSLPSSITSIEAYAFNGCTALALTSLPTNLTTIPNYCFSGCTSLAISQIPTRVTSIGTYAFQRCSSITSITSNGGITSISSYAFNGISSAPMSLTDARFPNAMISSFPQVFGSATAANACLLLTTVDLGSTQAIASSSFTNCQALQTLILRRSTAICTLTNVSAFNITPLSGYNSLTGTVYVPSGLISTYRTATNWSTLYNNGTVNFVAIEGSQYEL